MIMLGSKILALLPAVWFLFFWEMAYRFPTRLILFFLAALPFPVIFLIVILRRIKKQGLPVQILGAPPLIFLASGLIGSFFVDRPFLARLLMIVAFFLLFLDFYYLDLFSRQNKRYPIGILEKINFGLIGFSFFLISASLFGWVTFLAQTLWPFLLVAAAAFYFLFLEMFFLRKIETPGLYFYNLILVFLAIEFFWAISLLPVGFFIKGLVLTLVALYLSAAGRQIISETFSWKIAGRYLVFLLILIAAILGLAKWI